MLPKCKITKCLIFKIFIALHVVARTIWFMFFFLNCSLYSYHSTNYIKKINHKKKQRTDTKKEANKASDRENSNIAIKIDIAPILISPIVTFVVPKRQIQMNAILFVLSIIFALPTIAIEMLLLILTLKCNSRMKQRD